MRITKLRRLPPSPVHLSARFARLFPSSFIPFFAFFPHYAAWSQANVMMVLQERSMLVQETQRWKVYLQKNWFQPP